MTRMRSDFAALPAPLRNRSIRQVEHDGKTLYAAVDVVAALTSAGDAPLMWSDLKRHEPALARLCVAVVFPDEGQAALPLAQDALAIDAVDLEGMLRLAQSVPSAKAERLRQWLASGARDRLEEANDPELAVLRTRRLYEHQGYSSRWVDKRLRGVSARQELTSEWHRRGASEGEQFRVLTNDLMSGAFGMAVEPYRRFKNLFKTGENLRDHMSDLELALTALGETVAVELHRERDSRSFAELDADAKDAGEIVSRVRKDIEARTGRPVVEPANHRGWWTGPARRRRRLHASRAVSSKAAPGVASDPATVPPVEVAVRAAKQVA